MLNKDINFLIVDDEFSVRDSLFKWFKSDGFAVAVADSAETALEEFDTKMWDIVLLDIKMPGMDGIELNRRIQNMQPDCIVIIMTAYATVETAVQALKDGAFEYITKPIDPENIKHIIRNALDKRRLLRENTQLREKIDDLFKPDEIIGNSPNFLNILKMVDHVAETDSTVMIRGESGTGKELIARAIHAYSSRRYAPIISLNCGAFTESLLESELFGYEKGAFTGADHVHIGKIEQANKGTLFFDEIGNISMKMQINLLRILETKQLTRIGGHKTIHVDFRVISATNLDIEKAVGEGQFREDLYYRLNVITIGIPPLRDRRQDIPLLVRYFLTKNALSMSRPVMDITSEALDMLTRYSWPGNIRELRNVVERAVVVCHNKSITAQDISFPFSRQHENPAGDSLSEMEKAHIKNILNRTQNNISETAKLLKIDRTTLYNKIAKYKLK